MEMAIEPSPRRRNTLKVPSAHITCAEHARQTVFVQVRHASSQFAAEYWVANSEASKRKRPVREKFQLSSHYTWSHKCLIGMLSGFYGGFGGR